MAHPLPFGSLAIEFFAKLAEEFALRPSEPVIIDSNGQQALFVTAQHVGLRNMVD
jgi:hypothetical protein